MRKTATYIYCDGPECDVQVEEPDEKMTPEGWYVVAQVNEKRQVPNPVQVGFTLCSLSCVATWAMAREEALDGLHRN